MKRRLGLVLVVVGIIAVVLGALSATAWRASNQVSMAAPPPTQPVVTSDPGVLQMMDGQVEITADAEGGGPVELVVAPTADVEAWVAGSPHQRLTGAADWETLAVEDVPAAEGATETVPSLRGVDGWPTLESGEGQVRTTYAPEGQDVALLAVTDGTEPAPRITLTWQREVATPWLWPGVIGGSLLAIAGGVLLALGERERRERAARHARRHASSTDETSVLPVVREDATTVAAAPGERRRADRVRAERAGSHAGGTVAAPAAGADTAAAPAAGADPGTGTPTAESKEEGR